MSIVENPETVLQQLTPRQRRKFHKRRSAGAEVLQKDDKFMVIPPYKARFKTRTWRN